MFNRHQAEITVMQFRGYSLPVHHCSGTVGPSPCPLLQALIRPRDLFRLLAIGMCHFLPVHRLGIVFLGRVEGQNITQLILFTITKSCNIRVKWRSWQKELSRQVMFWQLPMQRTIGMLYLEQLLFTAVCTAKHARYLLVGVPLWCSG